MLDRAPIAFRRIVVVIRLYAGLFEYQAHENTLISTGNAVLCA